MKKLCLLLLIMTLLTTACECIGGLGRDIKKSGEWMEEQATK